MRMSTHPPPQPLPVWQISGYDPILFSVQVVERVPITDKRVTIALANQVAVPAMQARPEELHGASRAALLRGGEGGGGRLLCPVRRMRLLAHAGTSYLQRVNCSG